MSDINNANLCKVLYAYIFASNEDQTAPKEDGNNVYFIKSHTHLKLKPYTILTLSSKTSL